MGSSNSEVNVRLPVTMKTTPSSPGYHISPPNNLNPPGPPFIYPDVALNLIKEPGKPASFYMKPPLFLDPAHTYLPPVTITAPTRPFTVYSTTPKAESPANIYLPASMPAKPESIYLPAKPETPPSIYLPSHSSKPPPILSNDILPPILPSKQPQPDCESSQGKLVIPIPLKGREGENCCAQTAQLILPIKSLDNYSLNKLKASTPDEIDVTLLIKNILENLL